jgi:N-acylneuraminate cytidylyltransferase/CMP-N,N'-diacetyllegionaminic acid synthase
MEKIVAIIPARGGSKGVKRKNIKTLAGKPLITWTIETALMCSNLDRIIVSTEDKEISTISKNCGAEVPFIRPKKLALDNTPAITVVHHVIQTLEEQEKYSPDLVMLLQPTSPFRNNDDIDTAVALFKTHNPDAVISVCETDTHPFWLKKIKKDGFIGDYKKRQQTIYRRQDLPTLYKVNGAIYLNRRTSLLKDMTFIPKRSLPYIMPKERSIDIDTPWDFYVADLIMYDLRKKDSDSLLPALSIYH